MNRAILAADLAHLRGVFQLLGGALEPQVELLFLEAEGLVVEFINRLGPYIAGLHRSNILSLQCG